MIKQSFNLIKLEADEGKVFDYKDLTDYTDPETGEVSHLYAKTVFLGIGDSADNYIEVDAPKEEDNDED